MPTRFYLFSKKDKRSWYEGDKWTLMAVLLWKLFLFWLMQTCRTAYHKMYCTLRRLLLRKKKKRKEKTFREILLSVKKQTFVARDTRQNRVEFAYLIYPLPRCDKSGRLPSQREFQTKSAELLHLLWLNC